MIYDRLIIDGYNLLHQHDALAQRLDDDIQSARHRLVRLIEATALRMARHTTMVFDGREAGSDTALNAPGLEILFSPAHLTADSVIEQIVCRCPDPERVLVVTSDRAERDTVSSAGAQTMGAQAFLDQCIADASKRVPRQTPPGREPKLGDLFPDGL